MTTINEISLQQLSSDQAATANRVFQLGQSLHSAIESNNNHVVRYVKEAQADTRALEEVLDSAIRLLFGGDVVTEEDKEQCTKHLLSFLNRNK